MGDACTSQGDRKRWHLKALFRECSQEGRPRGSEKLAGTDSSPGSLELPSPGQASQRGWGHPQDTASRCRGPGLSHARVCSSHGQQLKRCSASVHPVMIAFLWTAGVLAGRCRLAKDLALPSVALSEFLPKLNSYSHSRKLPSLVPQATLSFCPCCSPSAWAGKLYPDPPKAPRFASVRSLCF